jgi:hypothetical protein
LTFALIVVLVLFARLNHNREDTKILDRTEGPANKPGGPADGGSISDAEIRKLATQYRDDWLSNTQPESADILRMGVIQSVERTGDGWHVEFVTRTGHDEPEGMADYFVHVYIDRTGKLQKIKRGPGAIS